MQFSGLSEGTTPDWSDDVHVDAFEQTLRDEGFYKVLDDPFDPDSNIQKYMPETKERFVVYFRPVEGIIVDFETYGGQRINTSNLVYNWVEEKTDHKLSPEYRFRYRHLHGSHGSAWSEERKEWVIAASSSLRQRYWGIRAQLYALRQTGQFVTPWVEPPFSFNLSDWAIFHEYYGKIPPAAYEKKRKEQELRRFRMLPTEVLEVIGFEKWILRLLPPPDSNS